ncbi:MAG TPA: GntR family transcriptional regulator [Solirubrobacteraceae bacterium]
MTRKSDAAKPNHPRHEGAYQTIRERILSGVYAAGFRVLIDEIADELELSPTPVREALRRLEADGLVLIQPNRTARVAFADPQTLGDQLDVLAVLDGYVTATAAPRIGAAEVGALCATNERLREAVEAMDSFGFTRLDQEFHELIYASCDNAIATRNAIALSRRLAPARSMLLPRAPYRGRTSAIEHRDLVELIARDAPAHAIELAAREHKQGVANAVRALSHTGDPLTVRPSDPQSPSRRRAFPVRGARER